MPDQFAELAQAAKDEEFQADAKGQIAQLSTEKKLAALEAPESLLPPGYQAALTDGACNFVGAIIGLLPLWRFGDKVAPIAEKQTLLAGNVLSTALLSFTRGRWQIGVTVFQVAMQIANVVSREAVKLELTKRSEAAKNPKPPPATPPPPLLPQQSVTIPFPPPSSAPGI